MTVDNNDMIRVMDRDGDGMLSVGEVGDLLTRLGDKMTGEEVEEMIRIMDPEDRGVVTCQGEDSILNRYVSHIHLIQSSARS